MALHRVKELIDGEDFANDLLVLKEMHEKSFWQSLPRLGRN